VSQSQLYLLSWEYQAGLQANGECFSLHVSAVSKPIPRAFFTVYTKGLPFHAESTDYGMPRETCQTYVSAGLQGLLYEPASRLGIFEGVLGIRSSRMGRRFSLVSISASEDCVHAL